MKTVFLDISTYKMKLPEHHRRLLQERLILEEQIRTRRIGTVIRGEIPYSRGLLQLATQAQQAGHDVLFLVNADPADRVDALAFCREADIVFMTCVTASSYLADEWCAEIKKTGNAIIVVGGPHVSAIGAMQALQEIRADVAVVGDGEAPLSTILRYPKCPDKWDGMCAWREGDRTLYKNSSVAYEAPHVSPNLSLLRRNPDCYTHNLRSTNGCSFPCGFCSEARTKHGVNGMTVEETISELLNLAQYLPVGTLVHFSDPVFTSERERTLELAEKIESLSLPLVFSFDTRVDCVDEERLRALVTAGFRYIRLGFESMHDHQLGIAKKRAFVSQAFAASECIRGVSSHAAIHAYMLTGLPGTTIETLEQLKDDVRKLVETRTADVIHNKIFVPYPGTEFFNRARDYGIKIFSMEWSRFDRLSPPVYHLPKLNSLDIYHAFWEAEAELVNSYSRTVEIDLGGLETSAVSTSPDYIYRGYVEESAFNVAPTQKLSGGK